MAEIIIVNVVASATIGKELMLQDIAFQLEGSEYDQDRFPGLIYKLAEPKTAVLIFRSGKVVCTGARSIPDVYVAINKVVDKLRDMDMPVLDDHNTEHRGYNHTILYIEFNSNRPFSRFRSHRI